MTEHIDWRTDGLCAQEVKSVEQSKKGFVFDIALKAAARGLSFLALIFDSGNVNWTGLLVLRLIARQSRSHGCGSQHDDGNERSLHFERLEGRGVRKDCRLLKVLGK